MNTYDYLNFMSAGGLGAAKSLGGLFGGGGDPAKAANQYYSQIPGTLEKYMSPYIEAGQRQLPGLESQYGQLMNDPGARMNEIGAGYQQSPGYQFALDQAMQGASNAAAAGGMAGSPMHEQQAMTMATNLANQDYNQYLQNALGLYGTGLQGSQGLYNTGAQAGIGLGEDLASILQRQGTLAYMSEAQKNAAQSGLMGNIFGAANSAVPFLF